MLHVPVKPLSPTRDPKPGKLRLSYQLLNASFHFAEVSGFRNNVQGLELRVQGSGFRV